MDNLEQHFLVDTQPYTTLPFIKKHIIDFYGLEDVITMFPPSLEDDFLDYQLLLTYPGSAFYPSTNSSHPVYGKGFNL